MRWRILSAAWAGALMVGAASATTCIYVSPDGADSNPGTVEHPLLTPAGARDAVRALRRAGGGSLPAGGVEIVFADGVYRLADTLVLGAEDSGAANAPVVWRAEHRGKVVWSGDIRPVSWNRVGDPETLARLPVAAREHVVEVAFAPEVELPGFSGSGCGMPEEATEYPISVFQDGRRLAVAGWPKDGYARTGRNLASGGQSTQDDSTTGGFEVDVDSTRLAAWKDERDLWAFGLWKFRWADAAVRVRSVNPAVRTLQVDSTYIAFGLKCGAEYRVFNALCELDGPGQCVVDRVRRRLYLWPLETGKARFAFLPELVRGDHLGHVRFEGLVLEHARRNAIALSDVESCSVIASEIRHTSGWGVRIERATSCRVAGCDFHDLGRGGVWMRGGDLPTLTPGGNVADNNHIGHYGRVVYNYQPGVWLSGVGNRATHNLIHHSDHQAIAFDGNDHYIGWNVIHDTCRHNDDAGAIYCCQRDWAARGTVIERNLVHMSGDQPRCANIFAIYLDDFSSGVKVRGNLVNRASIGIYVGGGQDNEVSGNVFMNCPHGITLASRGIDSFAKNISSKGRDSEMFGKLERQRAYVRSDTWRRRYPKLLKVYDQPDAVFAHNALWNVITNNVLVGCNGIERGNWEKVGPLTTLRNNLELKDDPGFVDYFGMNWELKDGTPGKRMIGPTDSFRMGLYASSERLTEPVRFGADLTPPRRFGFERRPPTADLHFILEGNLPPGIDCIAEGLSGCEQPDWASGKRVVGYFGRVPHDRWMACEMSFVPRFDARLVVETMGARGDKTLYDDFTATGAVILNGGFEQTDVGWTNPDFDPKDERVPLCNVDSPRGFVDAENVGVPAAEGRRMACGNDVITFRQPIDVRKGVPVTIRFKARACPLR